MRGLEMRKPEPPATGAAQASVFPTALMSMDALPLRAGEKTNAGHRSHKCDISFPVISSSVKFCRLKGGPYEP